MGMDYALACDLRVSAEDAKWSMFYIKRGIVADGGGAWLLQRMIGFPRTCELIYTGRIISGKDAAEKYGFVNLAVPAEDLDRAAADLAAEIAEGGPIAMELVKRLLLHSEDQSLEQHLEQVAFYSELVEQSKDLEEGLQAWMEKRKPAFQRG
jgi:2-(1,2-epoxy-1,2-dihydrophenyl)acetyl-CoA isomerase